MGHVIVTSIILNDKELTPTIISMLVKIHPVIYLLGNISVNGFNRP